MVEISIKQFNGQSVFWQGGNMCGRFNLIATPGQVQAEFGLDYLAEYETSYNIPPGQAILNITQLPDGSPQASYAHWGVVLSWSKDRKIANHLINASAETLSEKPSFRVAYKKRHCLILSTGFYEWHKTESGKQAYHIAHPDQHVFAFAGLWEYWEHGGETLYFCAIITTAANVMMLPIHERMPVIIAKPDYRQWLDSQQTAMNVQQLMRKDSYAGMTLKPISSWINNPQHNGVNCLS